MSSDAHEGKFAAILRSGKTTLPPIQFTTLIKHRVTCWLKATKSTEVTLTLHHTADGKASKVSKTVTAGPKWTEVAVDFYPTDARFSNAHLVAEVTGIGSVLMDAVRRRPILKDTPK